jgi:hypothetical protein
VKSQKVDKVNQVKKLQEIIRELRAYETKMQEGDHVGFGLAFFFIFAFAMMFLIDGEILIFIVLSSCLTLAIPAYYWISALRARRAWYWEEVRRAVDGKDLREMWDTCERGDWLLWFSAHMIGKNGWPTHQQIVMAACQCARLVIKHVKSGEMRPLKAIEMSEAWARGEATLEQVRNAGEAAHYMERNDTAYCAAEAAHDAAWTVHVREDGRCFRLAQAASGAVSRAAEASSFDAQHQISDVTLAARREVGDRVKKQIRRECADIVRQMLTVPNKLTNESLIYRWVKRWERNTNHKRTGRMEYIPIAVSRSSPDLNLKNSEMDNTNLDPDLALRIAAIVIVSAAAWALIGALGKNPNHYYTMVRWLTCSAAMLLVWRRYIQGSLKWAYILVPMAILFNPIIPIHLHGNRLDVLRTWHTADVVCAVALVLVVILMEIEVLLKKKIVLKPPL